MMSTSVVKELRLLISLISVEERIAQIPLFLASAGSQQSLPFTYMLGKASVGALFTAQKMKFSIKDFFSKCDQIHRRLRIWSHLLKKSLMENFIFYAVIISEICDANQNLITHYLRAAFIHD